MKYLFLVITTLFIFAGCSGKEIGDRTNEIVSDVSHVFDSGVDK